MRFVMQVRGIEMDSYNKDKYRVSLINVGGAASMTIYVSRDEARTYMLGSDHVITIKEENAA